MVIVGPHLKIESLAQDGVHRVNERNGLIGVSEGTGGGLVIVFRRGIDKASGEGRLG